MPEQSSYVDKLVLIILAFHGAHPSVPLEDLKAFTKLVGDITSEFTMEITKEQISNMIKSYENR